MKLDAHQHFWTRARGDYGWLTPALGPIWRDFGPADLAPFLARHGIDRTILVQAAPSEAETRFMLEIAAAHPVIAGVVGWTEFAAADAPERIAALAADRLLVGLRPMVQDIADDDWLLKPELAPAFAAMERAGLVFDALVLPRHLPRLLVVLDRHPGLQVVVDHAAKPQIRDGRFDPWRTDLAAVAQHPQVRCKLSGLVTEARADWGIDDLRPVADHLLSIFGSARILWGSDWPVVDLAGGYDRWVKATEALLAGLSETERTAVLGGNAAALYLSGGRGRP